MKEDYTDINAEEGTTPTLTDTDGNRTEPLASQHDANTDAATTDTTDTTASADTTEKRKTDVEATGESLESQEARKELKRIVEEIAREDERPMSSNFSLKKILGGEFLQAKIIKQYKWLIVIIVGFMIVYVSNRYSCDQKRIQISKLNKELEEAKFRAMTTTSELTKISRESNVLQMLQNCKDSVLHIPNQPPYVINVPEQ